MISSRPSVTMPDEKGIARDAEQFVPVAFRQGAAAGVRLAAAL
ncbi:MAG: hypothetical protein ACJ796_20775 [Gemmatimonadaceae bacterium]